MCVFSRHSTVNRENSLGYDWNSNDLCRIDLAGVASGRAHAQARCVPLYVSPCGTEICGLAFSSNTNILSTERAIMLQLGCAQTDNKSCSGERFLSMFLPAVNSDRGRHSVPIYTLYIQYVQYITSQSLMTTCISY